MPLEESLIPADWLRIAEKDLLRVERALRDADPEAAGFWLQPRQTFKRDWSPPGHWSRMSATRSPAMRSESQE
jgi:hypothetical protein